MKFELIIMAIESLLANKIRTLLSMLGIIIGVSTVIAVVGIGLGAEKKIADQFKNLSVNSLLVFPSRGGAASSKLEKEDVAFVLENAQFINNGTATISGNGTYSLGKEETTASIQGSDMNFFEIANLEIEYGRFYTEEELKNRKKVIVLGSGVATELNEENPESLIGEMISVAKKKTEVIGILKENGSSFGPFSYDDTGFAPFSTAERSYLGKNIQVRLMFLAKEVDVLLFAQEELTTLLRENHKLKANKEDDFRVRDAGSMVASAQDSTETMTMLLTGVATIVLIVSGIGIMNVMFVTVAERTKEIGIMKAIGAKQKDILLQFLLEAIILSTVAGLIGIFLGQLTIPLLKSFEAIYSFTGVALSFGFSVLVGVFFGFYPALKASKLDPVEALRSE